MKQRESVKMAIAKTEKTKKGQKKIERRTMVKEKKVEKKKRKKRNKTRKKEMVPSDKGDERRKMVSSTIC